MKKQIYNAGSMFNEAQWNTRKIEGKNLRKAFPNFNISNPVDFETNKGLSPSALEIWNADYKCVKDSDYIIFELDSLDHGMIMEFAIAIEMAKTTQPNKFLVPIISDFRYYQKTNGKELAEMGMNYFVYGAIFDEQLNKENRIFLANSHNQAIEMIKNREKFLETKNDKYNKINQNLDNKFLYHRTNMY